MAMVTGSQAIEASVNNSRSTSKSIAALLKYLFNISVHFAESDTIPLSSMRVIFKLCMILSEDNGFTYLQNFLLSVIDLTCSFS